MGEERDAQGMTERSGAAPGRSGFPAPVYRDTVLAPIFAEARRYFLEPLLRMERAHIVMLARQGILPLQDAAACLAAVASLDGEVLRKAAYDGSFEDLFFFVEAQLALACGEEIAGKIHTARSRNDIDLTMYRMLLRDRLLVLLADLLALRAEVLQLADRHKAALMPAYTHNQPAQPTTLGHYLMAFAELLERDAARVQSAYRRVNRSPLGACAITTTGFPIDRDLTANLLGFDGLQVNSYGAIAAVDYLAESCGVLATAMLSLGRLVQDLLLWSTAEFGYLRLSAAFLQISSIMPQKRNPVALEHVRILASRALFGAQGVVGSLHNTPFADMNDAEDQIQPLVYRAFEDASRAVRLLTGVLADAAFDTARMAEAAERNFLSVTELADTLVRRTGLSFHAAHGIVSAAVSALNLAGRNGDLEAMTAEVQTGLQARHPELADRLTRAEIRESLQADHFVAVRRIPGGPALEALVPELARAQQQLETDRGWLAAAREQLRAAERRLDTEDVALRDGVAIAQPAALPVGWAGACTRPAGQRRHRSRTGQRADG